VGPRLDAEALTGILPYFLVRRSTHFDGLHGAGDKSIRLVHKYDAVRVTYFFPKLVHLDHLYHHDRVFPSLTGRGFRCYQVGTCTDKNIHYRPIAVYNNVVCDVLHTCVELDLARWF